jgi:hypothetical protein
MYRTYTIHFKYRSPRITYHLYHQGKKVKRSFCTDSPQNQNIKLVEKNFILGPFWWIWFTIVTILALLSSGMGEDYDIYREQQKIKIIKLSKILDTNITILCDKNSDIENILGVESYEVLEELEWC